MKFLILSFLAAFSLVTCETPPTGPEFELDPKNPLHRAITHSTHYPPTVLKQFRLALYEIAGADRSVASFERVLTGEGAKCRREAGILRCSYDKFVERGGGWKSLQHMHFAFDITVTPDQSRAAQLRLCLSTYIVNRSVDPNPAPPPPSDSTWGHACN